MRNTLTLLLLYSFGFSIVAQTSQQTQIINVPVQSAILYLEGAELTQNKTLNLTPGRVGITFAGISSKLVSKSVQVTASGDVTILSVSDKLNYLSTQKESPRIKQLKDSVKMLTDVIAQYGYEKDAFEVEKKMLIANQSIGGQAKGVVIAELKVAADYFRSKIKEINEQI
ncbi:MAG TPA: DUF4140 domain-containing protein, partial [Nitrosopumilaceae archaeon]|nr:DUF4140 domain-containing protein [Nitrosopumilaceae archaeon]